MPCPTLPLPPPKRPRLASEHGSILSGNFTPNRVSSQWHSTNYLFAGSPEGGRRAAIIYTLIGAAELNGWDPQAYLHVLLERIAAQPINRIGELAPWYLRP